MKIPTVVARSILKYIREGGSVESEKAKQMLLAMGWTPDGARASQQEIEEARVQWLKNTT